MSSKGEMRAQNRGGKSFTFWYNTQNMKQKSIKDYVIEKSLTLWFSNNVNSQFP